MQNVLFDSILTRVCTEDLGIYRFFLLALLAAEFLYYQLRSLQVGP